MLVQLKEDGTVVSYQTISDPIKEAERAAEDTSLQQVEEIKFQEHLSCYEVVSGVVQLKTDWETIKAAIEAAIEPVTEPPAPDVVVTPIEFKLLWTSPERIKIRELRTADLIIDDFMDLVEDPRLTEVNLSLQSTQDGVDYILTVLEAAGTVIDKVARRDSILSGTPV